MMMNYELSRLCDGEMYVRNKYPSWSDVLDFLNILKKSSGSVNIRIINAPDIGPERLSVEAENGFYLVTLLEYDESGGDVRSIWDKTSSSGGHVIIRGNYWPERQLTKDFDLVVKIFKEFFNTGNVSTDLLN
ncbi:MAG: hypothetical protein E6661_23310 [Enterobacter sp.]|uniref:DUF6911 family protein n=1 Tax=Enterobacter TaxID=547 RepID=UPI000791CB59|nr:MULTISPECIES: hypothetical protein [Enterobacter]MCQ4390097.1 hypothetical protein [Enterobacter roggenkampii]MCU4029006.1 hypothetical protein [Enterobacter roggenkampii]MCU6349839.1 hypothetical protein [Enterobacter quasiroggenkampii]MCU6368792.1 hypothetical protein [Enterobacter quasiroggenkampii]MDU6061183.1 hypothetical protein [Enterobacter sp.]